MFRVRTFNSISRKGLDALPRDRYQVGEAVKGADALLLRSHRLALGDAPAGLLAVGRAGAGVNTLPVPELTERGVVVFNTPGANANAVKELVLVGLLLSCRGILAGTEFVASLSHLKDKAELNRQVEAGKKRYKGHELKGRTLGILGLGAIGSMVADTALHLEMKVLGYDPALSVDAAWRLPREVQKVDDMRSLFARSDIVSLHVPALESTRKMMDAGAFKAFKKGASLLNFAREELIDQEALAAALSAGQLGQYISDFPAPGLLGRPGVITTPHLGASTQEAEENCAMMVVAQLRDFLENGNIKNSVNFPALSLERTEGAHRLAFANRNVPRMLGSVLSILADRNINVVDMLNKSRDEVAYNLIDMEALPDEGLVKEILAIDGVIKARLIG